MQKILFDHIPKTGGSALHATFVKWYGDNQVTPQLQGNSLKAALSKYAAFDVIGGHFRFSPGERLPQDRLIVSIVRDPVDRALSSYYFDKYHVGGTATRNIELARIYDIEKFFFLDELETLEGFWNAQARHFASLCDEYDPSNKNLSRDDVLYLAREALTQFDVVGSYSDYEDFVAILGIEVGAPQWVTIPKVNVTAGRIKINDLEPKILERIRQLNELDIIIVEEVTQRFAKTRSRVLRQCVGSGSIASFPHMGLPERESPAILPGNGGLADFGSREIEILSVSVVGAISLGPDVLSGEEISIILCLQAHQPADDLTIGLRISEPNGALVFGINSRLLGMVLSITSPGQILVHFKMKCELGLGEYRVGAAIHKGNTHLERCYHWQDHCTTFHVQWLMGAHFEGMFRLYPSISVEGMKNSSSTFDLTETGISYAKSIMFQSAPLTDFLVHYQIADPSYQPKTGEVFNLIARVTNAGSQIWPVAGLRPVSLSYHWVDLNLATIIYDGLRTRLSSPFKPSQSEIISIQVQAPYEPGDYILQMTAVQENVGWFNENGCAPVELLFTVLD